MTPPAAATVAGRRVARESEAEYVVTRTQRASAGALRQPEARPRTRERSPSQTREPARPATRPSGRATAAAAALEATLTPGVPSRTRRGAPAPARPRREAPRSRPSGARRVRAQAVQAPRLALRLQPPRLDRIVRGRAWIPVLGVMLVAIVGLRVAVLKLGASVGSQIQQATLLQSSNTTLRSQISALSDNQRIEKMAAAYGMHMPNPLDVHFVPVSAGRRVNAAIGNISAPSNATFLSGLAAEQQNDQASTTQTSSLSAVGAAGSTVASASTTTAASNSTSAGSTPTTPGSSVSASTAGSTATGQTATGGTASNASTGASTYAAGGTPATGGVSSASSTPATAAGAGSTGLNTGPTNTVAGGAASQSSAATTSTGGTGLAG